MMYKNNVNEGFFLRKKKDIWWLEVWQELTEEEELEMQLLIEEDEMFSALLLSIFLIFCFDL